MAATVWNPGWVQEHTQPLAMHAFRMVETQHIAATMRLVDTAAEQDLLEQMLDASKPPLPLEAQGIHYLLAAPFRYLPPTGSRFRSAHMPGIWYGAEWLLTVKAQWHRSSRLLACFLLRDLMLPVLYANAWLGRGFEWRGHDMRAVENARLS